MSSRINIQTTAVRTRSTDIGVGTSTVYTNRFFRKRQAETMKAAGYIVEKVLEIVQPESVIDVGCGTGEYLHAFIEHGVNDVQGIDGSYVQQNLLVIPQESFMPYDLNQPFTLERTYDLVISLEVAEHLAPKSAESFIASLARLGSTILFSAAIPYQGGDGHINEQWPEYWANLFKQHGFFPVDALRQNIWHDGKIPYWYRQNMLFFCKEEVLTTNQKLAQAYGTTKPDTLSIVHPAHYMECNTKYLRALRRLLVNVEPLWRFKNTAIRIINCFR